MSIKKVILLATFVVGALFLIIFIPAVAKIAPEIFEILKADDHQALVLYLRSFGYTGAVILFILQFLQSLMPIFPAVILQITAGITYGPWWGTLIITVSYSLANLLIFIILRKYQFGDMSKLFGWKPIKKMMKYIQNQDPNLAIFILYLFPILSNSYIPYLAYTTTITTKNFIFVMIVASIPMTFASVYFGDRLLKGELLSAIIVFGLAALLSFGLYKSKSLLKKFLLMIN